MKRFKVTITVSVLASSEQKAWEYGQALASRDPKTIQRMVDFDPDGEESQVTVEDVE